LTTELERRRDSRCVFTEAYARMTETLRDELPRSTVIVDKAWVIALARAFAGEYFSAVEGYDREREIPMAWRVVFDGICHSRTSVLEDLVLPMTAHIVHDLPHALTSVGLEDNDGRSHVGDFHAVNDILGGAVATIRHTIERRYSPRLRLLDHFWNNYDQIATDFGLRESRGLAWYNAVRLLDPAARAGAEHSIEAEPKYIVDHVLGRHRDPGELAFRALRSVIGGVRTWPTDRGASPHRPV
jgi:hypothetical protein